MCPASGECCTMIFDGIDTEVFQYYLDFLAEEIPPLDSKRRLLSVDNASWHKAQRLHWHHFEVHYLPGYSPDLNPIERLWLRLKVDFFSDFIAKSPEQLTQRLSHALTSLMNDPETVPLSGRFPEMTFERCFIDLSGGDLPAGGRELLADRHQLFGGRFFVQRFSPLAESDPPDHDVEDWR
jgi:hypothetical protein